LPFLRSPWCDVIGFLSDIWWNLVRFLAAKTLHYYWYLAHGECIVKRTFNWIDVSSIQQAYRACAK